MFSDGCAIRSLSLDVSVPVCLIPPARFCLCAAIVLAGAEIDLARQGQPEPNQGLEQFLAGFTLFDEPPDRALDGRTELVDFVRFHKLSGYGRRPPSLPVPTVIEGHQIGTGRPLVRAADTVSKSPSWLICGQCWRRGMKRFVVVQTMSCCLRAGGPRPHV